MTMIERVARAISNADVANAEDGWEQNPPVTKEDYRKMARAAIEALREPTAAMLAAGYCPDLNNAPQFALDESLDELNAWWARLSPEDIWPSMLDAALAEKAE